MKNFIKSLIIGLSIIVSTIGVGQFIAHATTLNFVQTPTTSLYSSLASSGTSMRITPYPKDLDGVKLTMTDFGSNPTVTVDPKVKNYEEIVGFTGITDNGDNTATLTGLSRDLTSKAPYTTTGTGKQHGAGALVVFSNNPQVYARLAAIENTEAITGLWAFATSPTVPTPTLGTQAVNKSYVDSGVLAGAATSTETTTGISRLATQLQMASSTDTSPNTPLVLYTKYATSSPGSNFTIGVPITQNNGKLNQSFFDLTQAFTWSGLHTFNATTSLTAGVYIATSTPSLLSGFDIATSTYFSKGVGIGIATSTSNPNLVVAGLASTTNLIVSGTCTNCVNPTIISTSLGNFDGGTPSTATANATCTGIQKLSGGGLNGGTGSAVAGNNIQSYPSSATVWTGKVYGGNGSTAATGATVYAICVNP